MKEYAVYKGDELLAMGSAEECADVLKVKHEADKGLERKFWTPEQIEAHLKAIGADKPPEPQNEYPFKITAPKQGRWGKYLK